MGEILSSKFKVFQFLKKIFIYFTIYLHIFSIQFYTFASAQEIKPSTLPTAGIVKSGSADITQNSNTMNINQSSGNPANDAFGKDNDGTDHSERLWLSLSKNF